MNTKPLLAKTWLILLSIAFTAVFPYTAQGSCNLLFGVGKLQPGEIRAIQDIDGRNPFAHEFGQSKVFGAEFNDERPYTKSEATALIEKLTPPQSWNVNNSAFQRAVHTETIQDILHILEYALAQGISQPKTLMAKDLRDYIKMLNPNYDLTQERMIEIFDRLRSIIFNGVVVLSNNAFNKVNNFEQRPVLIFTLRPVGMLQSLAMRSVGVFPVTFQTTLNYMGRASINHVIGELSNIARQLEKLSMVKDQYPFHYQSVLKIEFLITQLVLPEILTWGTLSKRYMGIGAVFQKVYEDGIPLSVNVTDKIKISKMYHRSFQAYEKIFLQNTSLGNQSPEDIDVRWVPIVAMIDQIITQNFERKPERNLYRVR